MSLSKDGFQHLTGIIISIIFIIGGLLFGYLVLSYTENYKLLLLIIGLLEITLFGYILYKSIEGFKKSLK